MARQAGKVDNSQLRLATGTVAPSIPLAVLPGRSLSVPVGISYTAGNGVKVNDVASEVGLGWALNTGGQITREVRDRPDESAYGWINRWQNWWTSLPGSIVTMYKVPFTPNQVAWATKIKNEANADSEPDVFTLTLPTGSVQFVFNQSGNIQLLQPQNITIRVSQDLTFPNSPLIKLQEWTVITADGTKYIFGSELGTTANVTTRNPFTEYLTTTVETITPGGTSKSNYECHYKWLLRKVTSPTQEDIDYEYNAVTTYSVRYNSEIQHDYVYTYVPPPYQAPRVNYDSPYEGDPVFYNFDNNTYRDQNAFKTWHKNYKGRTTFSYETRPLAAIKSCLGKLLFSYESATRQDVQGDAKALKSIELKNYHDTRISKINLGHDYAIFTAAPGHPLPSHVQASDAYHLLLTSLSESDNDCLDYTLLSFEYNQRPFFRNSSCKDNWGYLNGDDYWAYDYSSVAAYHHPSPNVATFDLPGRVRAPNATYAKALILEQVNYANGGYCRYAYGLHDWYGYDADGNRRNVPVGGLRIETITEHDGVGAASDITKRVVYRQSATSSISTGSFREQGQFAKLQFVHGTSSVKTIRVGQVNQIVARTYPEIITVKPECPNSNIDRYYMVRTDESSLVMPDDYIDYTNVTVLNSDGSRTDYAFTSWEDSRSQDTVDPASTQLASGHHCAGDPLDPAVSGGPTYKALPWESLYSNVVRKTSKAPARGLLLKQTDRNENNLAVREIEYEYGWSEPTNLSPVDAVTASADLEVFGFTQDFYYFQLHFYQHISQWYPVKKITERMYDQADPGNVAKSRVSVTDLAYRHYLPYTSETYNGNTASSPPTKYGTRYLRPESYSCNEDAAVTPGILKKAGMNGVVIEEIKYTRVGNSSTERVLNAALTTYAKSGNLTVVDNTYVTPNAPLNFAESTTPPSGSTWSFDYYNGYQPTRSGGIYNSTGQLISSVDRSGLRSSQILGNERSDVLASVVNGLTSRDNALSPANSGYTSFERESDAVTATGYDGDYWSIGSASKYVNEAKTGSRSVILTPSDPYGPGKTLVLTPTDKKLVFSVWAKVPTGQSSGASFLLIGAAKDMNDNLLPNFWQNSPTYNVSAGADWQLYTFELDLQHDPFTTEFNANRQVKLQCYPWAVNGTTVLIDEVRVHPKGATMQTATAVPLLGITSATGADQRTSYQEYGPRNEVRLVKDFNKDIVKRTSAYVRGQQLAAEFTATTTVAAGCAAEFQAEVGAGCTGNVTYYWNYGDGITEKVTTSARTSHIYTTPGTMTASLIVQRGDQSSLRVTRQVEVVPSPTINDVITDGETEIDLCTDPHTPVLVSLDMVPVCESVTYLWQRLVVPASGPIDLNAWQSAPGPNTGSTYTWSHQEGRYYLRCLVTPVADASRAAESYWVYFQATYPPRPPGPIPTDPCPPTTGPRPAAQK